MTDASTTTGTEIQAAARHLAEGRPGEAAVLLELLVETFPAYVTAHVLLARAYAATNRREDALDAWHRAYFLMPRSPLVARQRRRLMSELAGVPLTMDSRSESEQLKTESAEQWAGSTERKADEGDQPAVHPGLNEDVHIRWEDEVEAQIEPPVTEDPPDSEPEWISPFEEEPDPVADPEPTPIESSPEPSAPPIESSPDTGWRLLSESDSGEAATEEPFEAEIAPPGGERKASHDAPPVDDFAIETQEAAPQPPPREGFELSDEWVEFDPSGREAPPEQRDPDDLLSSSEDLDSLIEQLENAPRIQPEGRSPGGDEEDFEDEVVTVTLARIYEAQKQFDAAARAYDRLAAEQPDRAEEFRQRADEMRRRAQE